ncbi:MAG TPA: SHOCT domain-containing protein [Solirubrobacterales bacterium]|nr:SHOCT domain-containing protein [Solirubrobacterales bacterium]
MTLDAGLLLAATWDGHMTWEGGWWVVIGLGMVLFWGLIILGAVLLVRGLTSARRPRDAGEDALALLDRRLASGELSVDEYRERRAVLRGE